MHRLFASFRVSLRPLGKCRFQPSVVVNLLAERRTQCGGLSAPLTALRALLRIQERMNCHTISKFAARTRLFT